MLPKQHRLTKKKDFDAVFTGGKGVKRGFLAVRFLKTNGPASRVGFVVSKKVSAKATVRNLVKRRLRKAVQDVLVSLGTPKDIIIIALPGIEKKEFSDIKENIISIFNNI